MRRIHFIAIGGAAMHNLALELNDKKDFYKITGSDDEIFEPSYSRLKNKGLLPEKMGWYPEKIHKNLYAVIVGMHARADNPELLRAKELGIRVFSFPEFLYNHSMGKTRVVVGGSHGKTTTTAMILYVLNHLSYNPDYMVGAQISGFENMVKMSFDARISVFEGDEYLTSPIDLRPKFHLYKPHIAVLTGIAWDHINVFPTFDNYVEQFSQFITTIETQGRLVYCADDEVLAQVVKASCRNDLVLFPYHTPNHVIRDGITYVKTSKREVSLNIFGKHNLQNMEAARIVCQQLGVSEKDFYDTISTFEGASNRMQKIIEKEDRVGYKDFAHSPSKLRATIDAICQQYPNRKIIACMELHTFSSLTPAFLPQYKDTLKGADVAYVYYNPKVVEHKKIENLSPKDVENAFGTENLSVFTASDEMQKALERIDYKDSVLIMMSSGNFSGIHIETYLKKLLEK